MNETGPAPDHGCPFSSDIPSKTHARLEALVIPLPYRVDRTALLHHPQVRIEVAEVVVGFLHRGNIFVAQSQIHNYLRGDAPVVLNEPGGRGPGRLDGRVAGEEKSGRWRSGEVILE